MLTSKREKFFFVLASHIVCFPFFILFFLYKTDKEERKRKNTSILIIVRFNYFRYLLQRWKDWRGRKREQPRKGTEEAEGGRRSKRSKVASKQTNRNARGSPTVINDRLVVILSPIKGVTPREASSRYFDTIEDHGSTVCAHPRVIRLSWTSAYEQ